MFTVIQTIVKMPKKATGGFYAVANGKNIGIYNSWSECELNVKGYPNARYKRFPTENEANDFINANKLSGVQYKSSMVFSTKIGLFKPSHPHSKPNSNANHSAGESKRVIAEITLDSPLRVNDLKRVRTDSPNVKGVKSLNGDKTFLPFIVDSEDFVNVYVDGACTHNGQSNPRAGVGVWFGDDHPLNISQPVDGPPTNNNAEIQAARLAVEIAAKADFKKLRVNTDSEFLIKCMTLWIEKWKANGWTVSTGGEVKNRVELEKLDKARQKLDIEWTKVPAHSGVHGNEMADKLASAGALNYL